MRLLGTACAVVLMGGCMMQSQEAPTLSGPSGFGRQLRLTATPDTLPRDGSSQSRITISYTDHENKGLRRRILLQSSSGTLSVPEVTTDDKGDASFVLTAPSLNTPASAVQVAATPVADASDGADGANAVTQTLIVNLLGPAFPNPTFTFNPATPAAFQRVTFDASSTTLAGSRCGSACSFAWDFGDGTSGSGIVADHAFSAQGSVVVTLTVTSLASGTTSSTSQTVPVAVPVGPTASFNFSPSNPVMGDVVYFDASGSRGANGATIVEYRWNFGNGNTLVSTSPTANATYALERSFLVQLTVVDSNSQTATTTQSVSVTAP
jgi:hypothetical protein